MAFSALTTSQRVGLPSLHFPGASVSFPPPALVSSPKAACLLLRIPSPSPPPHPVACGTRMGPPRSCSRFSSAQGSDETIRVVSMDRDYHVECYHCEVGLPPPRPGSSTRFAVQEKARPGDRGRRRLGPGLGLPSERMEEMGWSLFCGPRWEERAERTQVFGA